MVKARAVVEWVAERDGGRKRPPTGVGSPPYAAVVRFPEADEPWPPAAAWSLALEKVETPDGPLRWLADVHFLADAAPHEALRPGRAFDLYEGGRRVARVEVVGGPAGAGPPRRRGASTSA